MAAILATCMTLLKSGDHIVSASGVFGTTLSLFNLYLSKFGVATSYVRLADVSAWEAAIRPETRLFYLETPSNPLMELADIQALADLAHAHDILLVVDNCFCTPALQQPFNWGPI
jgi:O-succinylhomoserine sulfhydrylase